MSRFVGLYLSADQLVSVRVDTAFLPAWLWDDMYMNIANGNPATFDMVELKNKKHYNSHPKSRQILHWTTLFGIHSHTASTGGKMQLADPAANSPAVGWVGPKSYFLLTAKLAVDHMNEGGITRGFVY